MSQFGETLFGGSRFIFWALAPFLVAFMILMPLLTTSWNMTRIILLLGMEAISLLLLVGLYNPRRFWWALRGVALLVFCSYLAYLIDGLRQHGDQLNFRSFLSGEPVWDIIKAFIGVGIPCLLYTLSGRFSRR